MLLFFCYYAMPVWCHINQSSCGQVARLYVYPSHFNCVGAVSVVSSPDYYHVVLVRPEGDRKIMRARAEMEQGPTRRRSTCDKDRARAEMEQEQSKRDRVRERRWKQRDTASEESKAKEKSDRYSHDTSLTSRPQHSMLAPTRYTWL